MKESSENGQETIKWGGLLNEFLWLCAGVNRELIRQCPTEYAKYAGQGGLILFTGLMATLSGGYAFFTIFNSVPLASVFGVFWGLLIFNLDRFIVNTMYSDKKYTISKFEFRAGLPRIIIAIFLGIVISTPLELKIFEDRINFQIERENEARTTSIINEDKTTIERLQRDNTELKDLLAQRRQLTEELNEASREVTAEEAGLSDNRKVGRGPVWSAKKQRERDCQNALDDWNQLNMDRVRYLQQSTQNAAGVIEQKSDKLQTMGEKKGFCVRYEAFSNIKKENKSIRIVSLFIMLMFIIIEIAPTFLKMMVAGGPYDDLLRAEEFKKKAYADRVVAEMENESKAAIAISVKTNQERELIEIENNKALLAKIASIQSEVLEVAIQQWREEELKKAKENPDIFINNQA
jgi:hypothetical protein